MTSYRNVKMLKLNYVFIVFLKIITDFIILNIKIEIKKFWLLIMKHKGFFVFETGANSILELYLKSHDQNFTRH